LETASENEPKPTLFVKFYPESSKSTDTTLNLPPHWARLELKLELPKWTKETCLLEYIPNIKEAIKKQLVTVQIKRQLIEELIKVVGRASEVDTRTYSCISFLIEVSQHPVIITLIIKNKFPQDPPQIIFQSFIQVVKNRPFSKEWSDCPWSPRWSPQEMAKRLRTFIMEELPQFKKLCSSL